MSPIPIKKAVKKKYKRVTEINRFQLMHVGLGKKHEEIAQILVDKIVDKEFDSYDFVKAVIYQNNKGERHIEVDLCNPTRTKKYKLDK